MPKKVKDPKKDQEVSLVKAPSAVAKVEEGLLSIAELKKLPVVFFPLFPMFDGLTQGGIRSGQYMEIVGIPGIGKTTVALTLARNAIAKGYKCYYLDAEHRLEAELLALVGITDNFKIMTSTTDNLVSGEDFMVKMIDLVKETEKSVIILDSVASLEFTDENIGRRSREMTKFLRDHASIIRVKQHLVILLNHIKYKIETNRPSHLPPSTYSPGGDCIKYLCSTLIQLNKRGSITDSSKNYPVGHRITFDVKKIAKTSPFKIEVDLFYGQGIDINGNYMELAINLGIIKAKGSWFEYEDLKIQGVKNLINELKKQNRWEKFCEICKESWS